MTDGFRALRIAIARNPDLAPALETVSAWLLDALAERSARKTAVRLPEREAHGQERVAVRITRRGTRLLDFDNLAGGCKPLLDQIRYQNLISDDNPASVELIFRQEKVKHPDIGTEVLIFPI